MTKTPEFLSHRSGSSDLLTQVMCSVSLSQARECSLEARAPWSVSVGDGRSGLVAIREGRAVLRVEQHALELGPGDLCVLLEPGTAVLSDRADPAVTPRSCPEGRCTHLSGGGQGPVTRAIVGSFLLEDRLAHPFLAQLPPLLHLQRDDTAGRIEATLALLSAEAADLGMGSPLSIARLFELLFIQTLRAYLERSCTVCEASGASWLRAVTDLELFPALEALHADPLRPWTVARLARCAGMSRTAFALRFSDAMGLTPMRYVTRWRLHLAATALADGATLSDAAEEAGYGSEAAFAKAFKRELGVSPGRFRSGQRRAGGHPGP